MLGNLLGLKEFAEKRKTLSNVNALIVLGIFFKDWYNIKEASQIYNPELSKKWENDRVVSYYFHKFDKFGWFESKNVIRSHRRKRDKKDIYYPVDLYRLNYEPFIFEYYEHGFTIEKKLNAIRKKLLPFLNQENTRQKIIKNCSGDLNRFCILSAIKNEIDKKFNPNRI